MTRSTAIVTLLAWTTACTPLAASRAEPAPGEGTDLRVPSAPAMAPDGKRTLFTITARDPDPAVERARVWILEPGGRQVLRRLGALLGGEPPDRPVPRPLTRTDEDAFAPAFTPDGWSVSFLSARGEDPLPQVWVLPLIGGEAERWTDSAGGVERYDWTPEGALVWHDAGSSPGGLWQVRPGERTAHRLPDGGNGVTGFALSRDGRRLAFTTPEGALARIDLDDGTVRRLTDPIAAAHSPCWSHDEAVVYFLAPVDPARPDSPAGVWSVPVDGGAAAPVPGAVTGRVLELVTCAESNRVYLVAEDGASHRPQRIVPGSNRVEPLTDEPGRAADLTVRADGEKAAFVWQAPDAAPEIVTWSFPDHYVEPLTELNAAPEPPGPAEDGETP